MVTQETRIYLERASSPIVTVAQLNRSIDLPSSGDQPGVINGALPNLSDGDKAFIEMSKDAQMMFNSTMTMYRAEIDKATFTFKATKI